MTATAHRLFIAVNLSVASTRRVAEALDRLRRAADAAAGPRVVWVPAPNLHVTVKFLGWTRPEAIAAVRTAVAAVTDGRKGFEIEAAGAGAFPRPESPRVLWIGVRDQSGALAALAREVEVATTALGFEKEARAYHPHLTIGRVKEPESVATLLAPLAGQSFGVSLIREVVLYESTMKSTGSEYTILHRWPLDAPPPRTERQTRNVDEVSSPELREEPDTNGRTEREE